MMFLACQSVVCAAPTDMNIRIIESKLAKQPADQADIQTANAAVVANPNDAFTRFAAGEVLASLGLLELANEQYDAAEKLKPKFALAMFEYYLRQNDPRLKLSYPYVEVKHPEAPAVVYKTALILLDSSRKKDAAAAKMKQAADADKPWPGARGRYGMIEYNKGNLDSAIKYCNAELKEHKYDLMAQKVKIMALLKKGKRPIDLKNDIVSALNQAPNDEQLNLLLSRALIYEGKSHDAIWVAMRGLLYATNPTTLAEGRNQIFDLIDKVSARTVTVIADTLCASLPAGDFKATLFRMRVGELLTLAGHSAEGEYELTKALEMNQFFKEAVSYKLGKAKLKQKNYYAAAKHFHSASVGNPSETKYKDALTRTQRQMLNFKRDYALQLKVLLTPWMVH
jgi:Flp pilus assembly protein TadD